MISTKKLTYLEALMGIRLFQENGSLSLSHEDFIIYYLL